MKNVVGRFCVMLALAGPHLAWSAELAIPGPDRLPADTWVLVNWHGVASAAQVKDTNPVMKLWNDPQFAAAREQIVTRIAGAAGNETTPGASRAQINDAISALENPAVVGIAGSPLAPGADTVHLYAVINRKGKDAAWSRLHANQKPGANSVISRYSFLGVQIKKTVTTTVPKPAAGADPSAPAPKPKVSDFFEASLADYELFSDSQGTMESLITRLKDAKPAGDSLLQDATYRRAQRFRADGAMLEAFVKIPDLSKLPIPPNAQMNMETTLRELHPERLQGLWFSAGMGRDRMLFRGALIGDMAPGSLLDLIGGNTRTFQTLATAPATESYGAIRFDLPAFYATVLKAVKAGMPPDRGAAASMMIDSMAVSQTGLRATELLALFTGELAVASNGDEELDPDSLPAAILLPLTSGEQVLTVMRKIAAGAFAKEKKVSGASVVEFDAGPAVALSGRPARRSPFFLAVAKDMLVLSSDDIELGKLLARNAAGGDAPVGSLAADATFQAARKEIPVELNGISYTDFARLNWEPRVQSMKKQLAGQRQRLLEQAATAEKGEGDVAPDKALAARLRAQADDLGGMEKIMIDVLPLAQKYLKVSIGGSWKAADGVFFDSFVY